MLLSAVSVLVVGQQSSEFPEGLMIYPVYAFNILCVFRWNEKEKLTARIHGFESSKNKRAGVGWGVMVSK